MTIDEVVVHNFGAYKGRHAIMLCPPAPDKPVVLFGGLNGAGKTTLLDALQLSLYGRHARCSNRGSLSYDTFLSRCINRASDPTEGAAVELQFRHVVEGKETVYRVHRSWVPNGAGVKETVEVLVDGHLDRILSDAWPEFADSFIPSRLSHLFFFDGDKIEALTDLNHAAELLQSAVQSLLGLDLVERLRNDLTILERRKSSILRSQDERSQIDALEAELQRLASARDALVQERAAQQNVLEQRQKALYQLETTVTAEGGQLVAQKAGLEAERATLVTRERKVADSLRELAAGVAPLDLVAGLLERAGCQGAREREQGQAEVVAASLGVRDKRILKFLDTQRVSPRATAALRGFLAADRKALTSSLATPRYLNLDARTEELLMHVERFLLSEAKTKIAEQVHELEEVQASLLATERRLAAVPDEASLATMLGRRRELSTALAEAHAAVARIDEQLGGVRRDIEQREAEIAALLETNVRVQLEHEDIQRHLQHSQGVQRTLLAFRAAVIAKHLGTLEFLITDSLRQLLRKEGLITSVHIDPERFVLTLYSSDGRSLSPERLSAGERQLLAISILWALARASGRALPTAIDTPLGRLDASHRTHLIRRYFPHASHQVILFSTDEEIQGHYLEELAPWIGRSYRLAFDVSRDTAIVEEGYLNGGAAAHGD